MIKADGKNPTGFFAAQNLLEMRKLFPAGESICHITASIAFWGQKAAC